LLNADLLSCAGCGGRKRIRLTVLCSVSHAQRTAAPIR
jgi:hypothetical protein